MIKISFRLKLGVFCFFILGERKVGGKIFLLVDIIKEFFIESGYEIVFIIECVLFVFCKWMVVKNSEGLIMVSEWILVIWFWGGLWVK